MERCVIGNLIASLESICVGDASKRVQNAVKSFAVQPVIDRRYGSVMAQENAHSSAVERLLNCHTVLLFSPLWTLDVVL